MGDVLSISRLLSEDQVAELLDVSVDTVRRERKRGNLGFTRIGGRIRYTDDQVAAYLRRGRVDPCQETEKTDADRSENSGSHSGQTAQCGAEPGSTPAVDRRDAHRLAQRTFKKPRSNSPNGS